MLLAKDVRCNTHFGIINDFQEHYTREDVFKKFADFKNIVMQINENQPDQAFAGYYLEHAESFLDLVIDERKKQLQNSQDKLVIENYYKA